MHRLAAEYPSQQPDRERCPHAVHMLSFFTTYPSRMNGARWLAHIGMLDMPWCSCWSIRGARGYPGVPGATRGVT